MQTMANDLDLRRIKTVFSPEASLVEELPLADRRSVLDATYRRLFKENRDLDFFRNHQLDSAYLNGELTTRQLVSQLLSSEMYRDYIFSVNSNYRFVSLCFERVLGRPATDAETRVWSSLLATDGLDSFADSLVNTDEYLAAFGEYNVPTRRSQKLSPSDQGLPALPAEASVKRYDGPGRKDPKLTWNPPSQSSLTWEGNLPPKEIRQAGAILAGLTGIGLLIAFLYIVGSALGT